jgi:hypothetical protein
MPLNALHRKGTQGAAAGGITAPPAANTHSITAGRRC